MPVARPVARQVARPGVVSHALDGVPQQQVDPVRLVHIGLVVRPASVQAIQVEPRRPEIRQAIWVVLALKTACRVKRQVVIDELAEIGVTGCDVRILF